MKQKFTANILFLIGINLLIKPFYALAIDTSVQNIVGPESYGLFLAIFNFVYIQQVFSDLGVQNFNNRNISRNPDELESLLPKVLGAKLIFSMFFILITLFTSWIFGYLQYFEDILLWIIASQASLSLLLYLRTNISGSGRYFSDSLFSVLDKLLLIIWMSYVIWGNPGIVEITISYFVKVQFASILIAIFFVLVYTNKRLARLRLTISPSFIKQLLRNSIPYATLVLLMAGYSRLDGIMLEQLVEDNALEAGRYARSFRLYDTFNNFMFLFAVLLLPMFSRMIKEKLKVNEVVNWAFRLLMLASLFTVLLVYFEGADIMMFFYEGETSGLPWTLILLMIAGVALSLNYIYGTLLTANGNIKLLNLIAIGGFVLNLILNLIVIPKYGKEGAAFATLVTQFSVLLLQMILCYRYFDLENLSLPMLKIVIATLASAVVFYFMDNQFQAHFFINFACAAIVYLTLAILLRLIRASDLKLV